MSPSTGCQEVWSAAYTSSWTEHGSTWTLIPSHFQLSAPLFLSLPPNNDQNLDVPSPRMLWLTKSQGWNPKPSHGTRRPGGSVRPLSLPQGLTLCVGSRLTTVNKREFASSCTLFLWLMLSLVLNSSVRIGQCTAVAVNSVVITALFCSRSKAKRSSQQLLNVPFCFRSLACRLNVATRLSRSRLRSWTVVFAHCHAFVR